jgi:hypothetical protein
MGDKRLWGIIEKRGVVLREVVNLVGRSCNYGDLLHEVVDDPHYYAQLSKRPSKAFVRVSIILEPINYEDV